MLPNGDILVAEGKGQGAPALRPKDIIAGFIKGLGKSPTPGGNRLSLLRDATGGWTVPLWMLVALSVPLAWSALQVARPGYLEDEIEARDDARGQDLSSAARSS